MNSNQLILTAFIAWSLQNIDSIALAAEPHPSQPARSNLPQPHQSLHRSRAGVKGAQLLKELPTNPSEELTLPSDMEMPEYSALARAWSGRSETISYEMTCRNGVRARMAIRQIRGRDTSTVYVFIAGLFSNSETWKYVAGAMKGAQEIWAVDLVGTGLSDCPDPDKVGSGGYGPEALAERVLQALQARLAARPEVSKLIIAGHSLGGMITLRMCMNEDLKQRYPAVLEKVQGLVLLAPSDVIVTQATESWNAFFAIDGFKAGVGNALQILQYQVVQALRESFCNPQLASREVAEYSIAVVRRSDYRRATQAMMRDAVPWRVFNQHADFEVGGLLEARYGNVTLPCLLVWGKCDESLPEATGYKIKDQLPDARLVVIPRTKHLLTLERPRVCASLINQFHTQLKSGSLSSAHSVKLLEPQSYEENLVAGNPATQAGF